MGEKEAYMARSVRHAIGSTLAIASVQSDAPASAHEQGENSAQTSADDSIVHPLPQNFNPGIYANNPFDWGLPYVNVTGGYDPTSATRSGATSAQKSTLEF